MTEEPPEISVLTVPQMEPFLERYRQDVGVPETMDAAAFIAEVLRRADSFVPSEAGSVFLDRPLERAGNAANAALYFIATFGPRAQELLGASVSAGEGVVGKVYQTGVSHLVRVPDDDPYFSRRFDDTHAFRTWGLLAVPIRVENRVCGVIEMVNRRDGNPFDERDRDLLEIFASYTSLSIQTLLDAKRAGEAARSDDLTGLGNDRYFHRRLAQDLEEADGRDGEVALLFMDLDNFKSVNDSHGHLAGSQVLKEVGYVMRRVIRTSGSTLARYGGDEFVAILPGCGRDEAARIAEELRREIRGQAFLRGRYSWAPEPVDFHGPLTCSIGVAVYPDHAQRSASSEHRRNQLLRAADQAMYEAKSSGKDRVRVAS